MVRYPIMAPGSEERAKTVGELCRKGLWREALVFARKWRDENATDYRAHYYLGRSLTGLRKFFQAEQAYRRALAINPADFEVWNALAELLYRNLRRPVHGIQCLEQALKINPQHKLGWLKLATLNGRMGYHDKALQCADQALARDRKLVEAQLSRAAAARALGKMDIVQEVCRELGALEPENFHRAS
jgi:tetratricopeptide (TPR) repeat protein